MNKKHARIPIVEFLLVVASLALAPYLAPARTPHASGAAGSCEPAGDL